MFPTKPKSRNLLSRIFRSATKKEIIDYTFAINGLIWQRQAIFFAATVLAAVYFDFTIAVVCYTCVLLTEILDLSLARRVRAWQGEDLRTAYNLTWQLCSNTVLSATAISIFVLMTALQQGPGGHFTPLFFLFAAALFATMNNHQVPLALALRLSIYAVTFLTIASMDIVWLTPPLTHSAWLEFFTTIFVLYFILDVSFAFFKMYRRNQSHLRRLQHEHQKTKKAYRVKSNFISTVSHELRTPLTSIKGSLDLINSGDMGEVPEDMVELLLVAGQNCERLGLLINDVLDVQQIEAGQFVNDMLPVDLEELVAEIANANQAYAATHGVQLEFIPGPTRPTVLGDRRRLGQVLTNLMSNAIKFSPKGEIVTVWVQPDQGFARVYVKDQGVGIPEHARDKVFGQFSQVDSSDKRGVGGTGLGLHISEQIVRAHRGRLDFTSKVGAGTTFFMQLDLLKKKGAEQRFAAEDIALRTAAE